MSAPSSPPSPTGLASPRLLRAVEPTLSLHLDSEDDEPAIGSRSSARSAVAAITSTGSVPLDEEEITLLPPAAASAAGLSGTAAVDPSPVAVDEPASDEDNDDGPASSSSRASAASAASRNGAPSSFSSSSAAGPPEPQAHYASHLWFGVDAVLAQAEAARASTKALGSFLREKAALDRTYGADLRKLTARWAAQADLPARASPAQSGTVVAGLVALRGLALQTASAIELQAERLDEEATDPFLDEAAEAMSAARAAEQKARAQCKALEAAMDNLAAHKAALQRACADLARTTSGSSPAPNKPSSSSSSGDSSWMSDLVGFTPFRSSGADLSRKVPALDAKYTAAIRRAREARGEFDVAIGATLAELERAEARRLRATREVGLRFAQTLHSTAAGTVKTASGAVATLGAVRPRRDLELFIADTVKRTGGRKDPPPLPVYRLFKGHPNYSSGGTPTGSTSARSSRRGSAQQLLQQQSQSSSSRSSAQRRGASTAEDPATDSDADAAESDAEEEEIELSEATDSDNDQDGGEEAGAKSSDSDSDDAEAETPAGSLSPTSAAQLNSAEQAAAESTFAALLDALKEGEHADADAALTIQAQVDAAAALLDRPAGRAALASALKRAVAAAAAAPPAQPSSHDLALAVEPIMPVSPSKALGSAALEEEDAEALITTGGSIFSSTPSASSASAPVAMLLLCPDSFDRLATLLLRLLDACQLAMHAQPAMSVLRASRRIARADAESNSAGASFFSASSVAAPAPASELMLSRLSSHDACSSVRLWELAYFESLARAQARRPSHRWHTAAEQRAHAAAQVDVAHKLLRRYANEMVSTPAMSDAQVIAFVDKFAHMQQMTSAHVADLLTLECFTRQGVRAMPSDANAGKRRPLVASSAAVAASVSGAASGAKGTPGKPAKKSGHKVPVAMPVAAPAPAPAPAPTPSSASLFSPASASSSSSTPSSRTSSSSSKARAGRSILQSARPPFDTALEVEVLGDMTDDMNDVGL